MKLFLTATAFISLVFSLPAYAADPYLDRNLAATCTGCHGPDGKPVPGSIIDPLVGMEKGVFLHKLKGFKAGTRSGTIMHQIAKGYTDEQLEHIVDYYTAGK